MLVAAACFTIMNVLIKVASAKFTLGIGDLVFWRMLFSTVSFRAAVVLRRDTFRTLIGKSIKPQYGLDWVDAAAVLCGNASAFGLRRYPEFRLVDFLALFSFLILKNGFPFTRSRCCSLVLPACIIA